jgi:drug/metabolite transporter (DMT)-like permease
VDGVNRLSVLVAAFLLGEVPRPLQALGIAMIVIGVIILSGDRRWLGTRRSAHITIALIIGVATTVAGVMLLVGT